ncbi:hypothetical protein BD414DRAFT_40301 [Trametes punicea]|nr:hypothetical protein BD414DRAFT_40301 [Trametes punicea]
MPAHSKRRQNVRCGLFTRPIFRPSEDQPRPIRWNSGQPGSRSEYHSHALVRGEYGCVGATRHTGDRPASSQPFVCPDAGLLCDHGSGKGDRICPSAARGFLPADTVAVSMFPSRRSHTCTYPHNVLLSDMTRSGTTCQELSTPRSHRRHLPSPSRTCPLSRPLHSSSSPTQEIRRSYHLPSQGKSWSYIPPSARQRQGRRQIDTCARGARWFE